MKVAGTMLKNMANVNSLMSKAIKYMREVQKMVLQMVMEKSSILTELRSAKDFGVTTK